MPLTERTVLAPVMAPAEVDLLILDLKAELVPTANTPELHARLARYQALLDAFRYDWRQLHALYGDAPEGRAELTRLRDSVRTTSRALGEGLVMRSNGIDVHRVLEGRILRPMLSPPAEAGATPVAAEMRSTRSTGTRQHGNPSAGPQLERPLIIIAAPRSGSTLLFETLSVSPQLFTLGGEAHMLVEGLEALRPGAPLVTSNRLTAEHATPEVAAHVVAEVLRDLRGPAGEAPPAAGPVRFLEKTPKNALRVPFFDRIFPDARYIFLWRDPRENLSSIIEAWKSGRWKTYNGLPGRDAPWSLLLPPGWEAFNERPLEEIAAFQWESANRIALDDLERLPAQRWCVVTYDTLCRDPASTVRRLCSFAGIDFAGPLAQHASRPLPISRFALTPPAPGKWRDNETLIERVLPSVQSTWNRLRALGPG